MFIVAVKIAFVIPVIAVLEENILGQQCSIYSKDHPGQEDIEASVHNCDTNENCGNVIAIYASVSVLGLYTRNFMNEFFTPDECWRSVTWFKISVEYFTDDDQ